MKKLALTFILAAFAASTAFAAWDFANPTYGTFATQAQMDTISGLTGSTPIAIAVDTDGSLIVANDPSGGTGNFIDINPAGGASGGSVLLTEPDVTAVTPETGDTDLDIDRMIVASDGTIYIGEHDSNEDIVKITRTGTPTPSSVAVVMGLYDMVLDEANNRLIVPVEQAYGAAADGISIVALPGGTVSDGATAAQIQAATGATGVSISAADLMPDGKVAFFDEANYGGADAIFTLSTPGASPTITSLYATSVFTSAPGLSNLRITPQGDIIAWNEYDATSSRLTIIPSGATSSANLVEFTEAQIQAALGLGATAFQPTDEGSIAIKVVSGTPNQLVVFFANAFADNNIYTMTFNELAAGVQDWFLYN